MQKFYFIGQDALQARLRKFLNEGNVSRSFLFFGPKHSGKATLARAFARAWVSGEKELNFSEDVCGEMMEISPRSEEKKGVTREKGIDVDSLRNAIRFASLSSASGRRAILVESAETMTKEAQNAFLKTLEEPASGVVIVMIAHALDTIVPTVISRCDRMPFGSVSKRAFERGMGDFSSEDLWGISLGLPGWGKEFLYDKGKYAEREEMREIWRGLLHFGVGERLRTGETLAKNIPKAIETLHLWAFLFREQAISEKDDARTALMRAEKMTECARLLKTTQVNGRLILENTLLGL